MPTYVDSILLPICNSNQYFFYLVCKAVWNCALATRVLVVVQHKNLHLTRIPLRIRLCSCFKKIKGSFSGESPAYSVLI